jgi:hypothetical protein
MANPIFNYDEPSDTLTISFAPGELATGIELTDHLLLRIDKASRRVIGLTLFDYSVLVQPTEIGPRSFPLTGLSEISAETRELVLDLLLQYPVRDYLTLSAYSPTFAEAIPIVFVRPAAFMANAA